MNHFDVGPEGMDIEEFTQRVQALRNGMQFTEDEAFAEIGRLTMAVKKLTAIAQEQQLIIAQMKQAQEEVTEPEVEEQP